MATALPAQLKPDRILCAEVRIKLLGPTPAMMAKMALADGHGVTYGQSQLHTCSPRSMKLMAQLTASLEQDFADALEAGGIDYSEEDDSEG